jgi:hypothetical protein
MILTTDMLFYILIAGISVAVALGLHTEWRLSRLLRGKSGKSLEELIGKSATDIGNIKMFRKELEAYLESVEKRLQKSVCGVGVVRFNPFRGTGDGGNQSFASAFIDAEGNGVVFSTLHTRERMSMFAKPLRDGKSEYELTEEERRAIQKAKEGLRS